jgi:hypothetical protein
MIIINVLARVIVVRRVCVFFCEFGERVNESERGEREGFGLGLGVKGGYYGVE